MKKAQIKTKKVPQGNILVDYISRLQADLQYLIRMYKKDPYVDKKNILHQNNSGIIFDIGAHRGDTVAAYAKYFNKSIIYGFEPCPESYDKLKIRFEDNPRIRIIPKAVSNINGTTDFNVNIASATNSLLPIVDQANKWTESASDLSLKNIVKVDVTKIDSFCNKENIKQIMILKMDIQGAELLALQGAEKMLSKKAIILLYLELLFVPVYIGQAEYYQICGLLSKFGYKLFSFYNSAFDLSGQIKWCDGLFVSHDLMARTQ